MKQEVGDEVTAFDGMWCRVNNTEIDLGSMTFQTQEYLMSGRMETGNEASTVSSRTIVAMILALVCILLPMV